MIQLLFLFFLVVPIVEIYLLIKVGSLIGALPTIGMVVFTAVLGAWLLRVQGLATLLRVRDTMARGGLPALELLEGAALLVAGALLLTPGFFTDTIGFLLLVPPLRRRAIQWLLGRATVQVFGSVAGGGEPRGPHTIDGDYRRED